FGAPGNAGGVTVDLENLGDVLSKAEVIVDDEYFTRIDPNHRQPLSTRQKRGPGSGGRRCRRIPRPKGRETPATGHKLAKWPNRGQCEQPEPLVRVSPIRTPERPRWSGESPEGARRGSTNAHHL